MLPAKKEQPRPAYDALCDLLRKTVIEDGHEMSDEEIRKGADRLMGFVELLIKIDSRNNNLWYKADMKAKIKKLFGFIIFSFGLILAGWIGYNLFIERLPATEGRNPIAPSIFAAGMLYMGWKSMFEISDAKAAENPLQSYEGARMAWLNVPYPPNNMPPNYIGDAEAYMVGMEFTLPQASGEVHRVIVLAGSAGDASIYFNSNNAQGVGGYIGGVTHENIAKDAVSMVQIASANISLMQSTTDFPLTSAGHVRFIVGTKNGRYGIEVTEAEAQKEGSPWYNLYSAGQQIITDYRLLEKKK